MNYCCSATKREMVNTTKKILFSCGSSYFIKIVYESHIRTTFLQNLIISTLPYLILRKIWQRKQDFATLMDRVGGVWDVGYVEDDMDDGWVDDVWAESRTWQHCALYYYVKGVVTQPECVDIALFYRATNH